MDISHMHQEGTSFRAPTAKYIVCLDLHQVYAGFEIAGFSTETNPGHGPWENDGCTVL